MKEYLVIYELESASALDFFETGVKAIFPQAGTEYSEGVTAMTIQSSMSAGDVSSKLAAICSNLSLGKKDQVVLYLPYLKVENPGLRDHPDERVVIVGDLGEEDFLIGKLEDLFRGIKDVDFD